MLNIPKTIKAGVNFSASVVLPAYDSGWEVLLYLRGPSSVDLTAAQNGSEFTFSAPASVTANWTAGGYLYSVRATNGADVVELESCQLTVLPDMTALPPGTDTRTENQKVLEAIEAVIAKRATMDQERYRINNRELYRTPIGDLLKLKNHYKQLVSDECCGGRKRGRIGSLRVGFTPIGR